MHLVDFLVHLQPEVWLFICPRWGSVCGPVKQAGRDDGAGPASRCLVSGLYGSEGPVALFL